MLGVKPYVASPLKIHVLRMDPRAKLPTRAYPGDAGWDLYSLEGVEFMPGERAEVRTGLAIEIPEGHYGRVTGRSSTIRKRELFVYEGVADSGFRGEWTMHVENRSVWPCRVPKGTALAQLILTPVPDSRIIEVEFLTDTERGARGYGSSG